MDRKKMGDIRREIARLIDSIKEHSDNIGNRERIPQLELELIQNKIEKLYEKSVIYNFLHQQESAGLLREQSSGESEAREEYEEEVIREEAPVAAQAAGVSSPAKQEAGPALEEKEIQPSRPESAETRDEKKEIGEKFQGAPSVHDRIATGDDRSLASKLRQSRVEDLVRAIGINQRFTFIQELFDNDAKAFAESVKFLNSCSSFTEADQYLSSELAVRYKWDREGNENVEEFISLVRRRFI